MISILLPTLFPKLAARAIESIYQAGIDDYEIVVVSPMRIEGPKIVWSNEMDSAGSNPATRHAFQASKGEIVIAMCDDVTICKDWGRKFLSEFNEAPEVLWALRSPDVCRWYSLVYATFPGCKRELVNRLWKFFMPYNGSHGDIAFSLAAHLAKVEVRVTKEQYIFNSGDRLGEPEGPAKQKFYVADEKALRTDFAWTAL
jgi:hypothetical protein